MSEALALAESMPRLVLQASNLANLVMQGLHGRRKAGTGDEFWQFRPFVSGESAGKIDWRRSARDHTLYIKENEWQVASLYHIFPDTRVSMQYGTPQKRESAIILGLALAKCLVEAGERVTLYGQTRPTQNKRVIEEFGLILPTLTFPVLPPAKGKAVVISDFFFDYTAFKRKESQFLVINAPSEIAFPFKGRVEFEERTFFEKKEFTRTENIKPAYEAKFAAHKAALLKENALFHVSDALPAPFLLHYLLKLAGKA